jgi:hypothetical protein
LRIPALGMAWRTTDAESHTLDTAAFRSRSKAERREAEGVCVGSGGLDAAAVRSFVVAQAFPTVQAALAQHRHAHILCHGARRPGAAIGTLCSR